MSGDPILDGITRFGLRGLPGYPTDDVVVVVPFSDLPALLAAAREDERKHHLRDAEQYGYEQGQRDEREAAARVVEERGGYHSASEFAAAIRAREEKS